MTGVSLYLVVVSSLVHVFNLLEYLDYRWCDSAFECRWRAHLRSLMLTWHTVDIFSVPTTSRPEHYFTGPYWWQAVEGCCLLFVATPPALSYYSCNILNNHTWPQLSWPIAFLKYLVCRIMAF